MQQGKLKKDLLELDSFFSSTLMLVNPSKRRNKPLDSLLGKEVLIDRPASFGK